MNRNEAFLQTAEALKPPLLTSRAAASGKEEPLKKGDSLLLDFGNHFVGYVTLELEPMGRHQDAPVLLEVAFYEHSSELDEKPEHYKGWIAGSWVQSERVHIDVLPCAYRFPRRYAFRYMKVTLLDCSQGFSVRVAGAAAECVSSADDAAFLPFSGREEDRRLDAVSLRTLHDCMQEVFEDGPKRDRRLWLGDLRLQALANYVTYRQNDLVRRCLYLFAGNTLEEGRVANNLFLYPAPEADGQFMFDYSLFFINTLWDYYEATGDRDTLQELEPTAFQQYELSKAVFDRNGVVDLRKLGSCFVDWNKRLDKQCSAQGIYLYALRALVKIEMALGRDTGALERELAEKAQAARGHFYHGKKGVFLSGPFRQVSYASQIWMVLAGVATGEQARQALKAVENMRGAVKPSTPYLYHHYIQALIDCGEKEKAYQKMKVYWGGMLTQGADTFWEVYDPERPNTSPYGGRIIHSYCHAWSCTPCYFLRKYFSEGEKPDGT